MKATRRGPLAPYTILCAAALLAALAGIMVAIDGIAPPLQAPQARRRIYGKQR